MRWLIKSNYRNDNIFLFTNTFFINSYFGIGNILMRKKISGSLTGIDL